ncbi:MAG: hypothetical protein K0R57_687 [Paenibacillaceae bacterium]|jgi:4-hydroxybenzoate polyprenyltransferase|nr:hypothetical protein [Paenibacillaceae bacterium]
MVSIFGLLLGVGLIAAGIYYLIKEKSDKDSIKIYRAIILIGLVFIIAAGIKIAGSGL